MEEKKVNIPLKNITNSNNFKTKTTKKNTKATKKIKEDK